MNAFHISIDCFAGERERGGGGHFFHIQSVREYSRHELQAHMWQMNWLKKVESVETMPAPAGDLHSHEQRYCEENTCLHTSLMTQCCVLEWRVTFHLVLSSGAAIDCVTLYERMKASLQVTVNVVTYSSVLPFIFALKNMCTSSLRWLCEHWKVKEAPFLSTECQWKALLILLTNDSFSLSLSPSHAAQYYHVPFDHSRACAGDDFRNLEYSINTLKCTSECDAIFQSQREREREGESFCERTFILSWMSPSS